MTQPHLLSDQFLNQVYELAGRVVDPVTGVLEFKAKKRVIRRKQLEVLAILAGADGKLVTRSTFIELAWDNNALIGDAGLTDTISDLRQSLIDTDRDNPLIRTIPRRGYQLSVAVRLLDKPARTAFAVGAAIVGKPEWHLQQLLSENAVSQMWLAQGPAQGPDAQRRVFRFCQDEQHLRLLRREATLLRYLRETLAGRSDIAQICDWQLEEPPYFLELEHLPLGSLASYANAVGGYAHINLMARLRWIGAIADTLDAVHQSGIVHRNLSANSIFMAEQAGVISPKLGEFGLSELADRSRLEALNITALGLTLPGNAALAKSMYLAPERLIGDPASAASDVYALGVLLYQATVGDLARAPQAGWGLAIESLPLRDLIAASLDAEPAQRPTAAIFAVRLQAHNMQADAANPAAPNPELAVPAARAAPPKVPDIQCAKRSWRTTGGESPLLGRRSEPPRHRVMDRGR